MTLITILGTFGTLSIIVLFYILAKLSERFGSVIKMPPIYRYFYLAILLLLVSYVTNLLVVRTIITPADSPAWLMAPWFLLLAYHLPMAIGLSIGLIITWRYWSWLITERNG
jgi:hypothetical protein